MPELSVTETNAGIKAMCEVLYPMLILTAFAFSIIETLSSVPAVRMMPHEDISYESVR